MKVAVFDSHRFEKPIFTELNAPYGYKLSFFETRLTDATAALAKNFEVVCSFANDQVNAAALAQLKECGVKLVALRSAGFNHVDLVAAARFSIKIARVPAYSPNAVAEHAVALMLALNRKICKASARVRELNFSLEGLTGFDLNGKTVGIIGTGRIGAVTARIMSGFGCQVLGYDKVQNNPVVTYTDLDTIYRESDIISLHLPLNTSTRHLIDGDAISRMKKGVMIINTGRGALIDTRALIAYLKSEHIGYAGLDVYEEEENIFFNDLSDSILKDDVLARLMTFPNVLITAHQAFLTREALYGIVGTTLKNIAEYQKGEPLQNEVKV